MFDFKWRHFNGTVILQCVRWYCKYSISYRDLEEMMIERGVKVNHPTLYHWVQYYAQEIKKTVTLALASSGFVKQLESG